MDNFKVLGIETSCDETSAGIVEEGNRLVSNVVYSQDSLHSEFGGVVPEIASRAHLKRITRVVELALQNGGMTMKDIGAIAVTFGPGLIGSLLVGINFAKGLSLSSCKPLIKVNHLDGHIQAIRLEENPPLPPFISLVVSGGHTSLYLVKRWGEYECLGSTRDDAAGEAFDKVAKLLKLGYPGGVIIDRISKTGDERRYRIPRGLLKRGGFDFSFSGMKTAVLREVESIESKGGSIKEETPHIAASFQRAVVDVLIHKTILAVKSFGLKEVSVCGGVACNSKLQEEFIRRCDEEGLRVTFPRPSLCTDNGAMIAVAGLEKYRQGKVEKDLDFNAEPYILP